MTSCGLSANFPPCLDGSARLFGPSRKTANKPTPDLEFPGGWRRQQEGVSVYQLLRRRFLTTDHAKCTAEAIIAA